MKKSIIAIAIMFIGLSASSQSIDFGVKGGFNFTNIMSLDGFSLEGKSGFHAGIFASARFSEKFGLQADVVYSQQGAKFTGGEFDLTYVNIPVVFKYYVVEGQGLNIQIGPQFGFLVDDSIKGVVNNFEIKAKANETDIAGVIGLGYELLDNFRLDGRYHLGFTEVSDATQAKGKNTYITLGLGYTFF